MELGCDLGLVWTGSVSWIRCGRELGLGWMYGLGLDWPGVGLGSLLGLGWRWIGFGLGW